MKKQLSIICVLAAMLSSCGIVNYVGIDPHAAPTSGENVRYVGKVEVDSKKEVYVLGLGGAGSHESAIREAIKKADLKEGEELVNMTCASHTRFIPFTWLPIVVVRGYYVTADKISHNMNEPVVVPESQDVVSICKEEPEEHNLTTEGITFEIPESEFAPDAQVRLKAISASDEDVYKKFKGWNMLKSTLYTSYAEVLDYLYRRPNDMNLKSIESIQRYMLDVHKTSSVTKQLSNAKTVEQKIRIFLAEAKSL